MRIVEAETAAGPEPATFDAFFRREHPRLVALAVMLTGDLRLAEDLAQEALLRAYRDWDRIREYDLPAAWVRRVLLNLATSAGRRGQRERRALALVPTPDTDPSRAEDDGLCGDGPRFWAAVRALPRRQAEVIALFYVEDLSVSQIAVVLACAEGTVKSHLHRGRAALAVSLRSFVDEEKVP